MPYSYTWFYLYLFPEQLPVWHIGEFPGSSVWYLIYTNQLHPFWIFMTFPVIYSTAKIKSSWDKESISCFV
jgi:hypothetical protein